MKSKDMKIKGFQELVCLCLVFSTLQDFIFTHITIFSASRKQIYNRNDRKIPQSSFKNDDTINKTGLQKHFRRSRLRKQMVDNETLRIRIAEVSLGRMCMGLSPGNVRRHACALVCRPLCCNCKGGKEGHQLVITGKVTKQTGSIRIQIINIILRTVSNQESSKII